MGIVAGGVASGDALGAYLLRIGIGQRPGRDPQGLADVQFAHRQAIGFENFDVRLGRGISLDPERIFAKLVRGQRGGYCFEHNILFATMLRALGWACRPLLARVWLGMEPDGTAPDAVPPRTHVLLLVDVGGELQDEDQHGNDHGADDGIGHVEATEQRHRLAHEAPDEEGDEADEHGGKLAQLDALHQFHESSPVPGVMLTPDRGGATAAWDAPHKAVIPAKAGSQLST